MGIGPIQAATIIAAIGSIYNFPSAAALKSYFGWAPTTEQSGTTLDHSGLTRGGTRPMRQIMFLIVGNLIQQETEWAKLYERLVQTKCPYDERTGTRKGKKRVMGRVAGQIIETMYALLKKDAEVMSNAPAGKDPPAPTLYDQALHRRHREGQYQPSKTSRPATVLTLLPHTQE